MREQGIDFIIKELIIIGPNPLVTEVESGLWGSSVRICEVDRFFQISRVLSWALELFLVLSDFSLKTLHWTGEVAQQLKCLTFKQKSLRF